MSELPSGWRETTLEEVADIIMGQSPKSETYNFISDGIPFYQGVTEFTDKYVKIKTYTNKPTKIVEKNTILFSVRAPVGRVNFVNHQCCIGRGNAGFLMKNGEQDFLYYLLQHIERKIQNYTSGTVFTSISGVELKKIPIVIPENIIEQKAIANILSSFDNKIELLKEQNRTLETLSQTIFKEFFINNTNSSWTKKSLSEIANFLNGLACQKYPPINNKNKLPVLKIKELKEGISNNSDWATADVKNEYIIKSGDVIFAWSASLIVKIWDGQKSILNQHLFKVTSKDYPKWFYFQWCRYHLNKFISIAKSKATTMGHIKRTDLDSAMCFIPSKNEIYDLDKLMSGIMDKSEVNTSQIQTLQKTRDTLLPKLMSGKLRVKGFEDD